MSLIKAALITALIGLVALIFLSGNLEPKVTKISDISSKNIDSFVKIQGMAINIKDNGDFSMIKVNDGTENITAFVWKTNEFKKINLSKNEKIEVLGKVTEYNGMLEISAETIRKLGVSGAPKTD